MKIDLHTHSTTSDGTYSPQELVKLAKEKGIEVMALTDHDDYSGLDAALAAGKEYGVEIIPGIEMSIDFSSKATFHLLGFFIDHHDKQFQTTCGRLQQARAERNPKIIDKLKPTVASISLTSVMLSSP